MPGRLVAQEYADEFAPDVIRIDCGDETYAVEVAEWIKGRPADAKDSLTNALAAGTRVWLYRDDSSVVVGFAALGATTWRWPPPDGEKQPMSIIPWFGIDRNFHGKPDDAAREDRYSYQMMGHLIARARGTGNEFLVLFVEADNDRAIRFYENAGFVVIDERKGYLRMALNLKQTKYAGALFRGFRAVRRPRSGALPRQQEETDAVAHEGHARHAAHQQHVGTARSDSCSERTSAVHRNTAAGGPGTPPRAGVYGIAEKYFSVRNLHRANRLRRSDLKK